MASEKRGGDAAEMSQKYSTCGTCNEVSRGLKQESGSSSLAKLPFQISHFLISVLGYIIALSRLPFNIYSVLDCNRFILHYFAEILKKNCSFSHSKSSAWY